MRRRPALATTKDVAVACAYGGDEAALFRSD
jgi:hypothetical protein